jgi:rare lipoprotein A
VDGAFVVQAAAFSNEANAKRAANSLDGFVQKSGRFFRVRTGPFTNRGQAEAALAKVRAAGYSDARVFTSG